MMRVQTGAVVLRDCTDESWGGARGPVGSAVSSLVSLVRTRRASIRRWVRGLIAHQLDELRDRFQLAITLPGHVSRLLGSCGVRVNDRARREGNIGYELNPDNRVADTRPRLRG